MLVVREFGRQQSGLLYGLEAIGTAVKDPRSESFLLVASTRENAENQNFAGRMPLPNQIDDGLGPIGHLLSIVNGGKVAVIGVVRSNKDHEHFGRWIKLQFTMEKIPQDVFRPESVVPQINSVPWRKMPFPHRAQRFVDSTRHFSRRVGDGIANQNKVELPGLDLCHFLSVALGWVFSGEIGVTGGRFSRLGIYCAQHGDRNTKGQAAGDHAHGVH